MDETNSNWEDLRLFMAVAEGGGLAKAAKSTGKSAPTLGRRMLALERRLGAELFRRLPRGYDLTAAGQQLLAQLLPVAHSLEPILKPQLSRPVVKLSAGTWVSHVLMKNVDRLADDDVLLRFISADHPVDMLRREAVIGIRNARPEQHGLAGRRIGLVRFAVYGRDRSIQRWARPTGETPSAKWVREASKGIGAIEVSSPRNALDLALAGAARTVLPTFVGDTYPNLHQLDRPIAELEHIQWIVTHNEDRYLPPVRKVIDKTHRVLKDLLSER